MILCTSDQLVANAANYTTHNKPKRRKSIPSAGFEPTIPATEWLQSYTVDLTATPQLINWPYYVSLTSFVN